MYEWSFLFANGSPPGSLISHHQTGPDARRVMPLPTLDQAEKLKDGY